MSSFRWRGWPRRSSSRDGPTCFWRLVQKSGATADELNAAIKKAWQPADAGLELARLEQPNVLELRSRRIFIEESLASEAMKADAGAVGILTYFVNEIRLGDKATPYSMVAAIGAGDLVPAGHASR